MKYHYSYCFLTYLIKWNVYYLLAIIRIYFIYILWYWVLMQSFLIKISRVCYIIVNNLLLIIILFYIL